MKQIFKSTSHSLSKVNASNFVSQNFRFIMFCTFLLCSAVWVSVSIETEVRKVYQLRSELNAIKTTYNYKNSIVSQRMRMTEIAKLVKPYGLEYAEQQPYRISAGEEQRQPQFATVP